MNDQNTQKNNFLSNENDEIDLVAIVIILWKNKLLIISVTVFFALCSVFYALNLENYYKSESVLSTTDQPSVSGNIAGLGGIASFAGIDLSSGSEDKAVTISANINSRAFLKHLLTFDDILPSILAAKQYNSESNQIIFNEKIYDEKTKTWIKGKPTSVQAFSTYQEQVQVMVDKKTKLMHISVEHVSPIFAQRLLILIIDEVNELMRNKDLRESSDAIAFLTSEMPKSSLISMKEALNHLVQSKLEMQMMAKINREYAMKIIEPPFLPEKKSKPGRAIICFLGTLIGGFLVSAWVLVRTFLYNESKLSGS